MPTPARLQLGAPGIYRQPEAPLYALTGERLDVCAFAGLAPRGPARVPVRDEIVDDQFWGGDGPCVEPGRPRRRTVGVAIESFDDYLRIFGGFEGPQRLLPYAVASFFENGGRRAIVARIVHDYGKGDPRNAAGCAAANLTAVSPAAGLRARSEGQWANTMSAQLEFAARRVVLEVSSAGLRPARGVELPPGTLLRVTLDGGTRLLRFVTEVVEIPHGERPTYERHALLDAPIPALVAGFEVVEAALLLDDGAGRVERFGHLGLSHAHPRWVARVLCDESALAWPEPAWAYEQLLPADVNLPATPPARFTDGEDRWAEITHEDFFDKDWSADSDAPASGICCFAQGAEAGLLVVPDLYSPGKPAPFEAVAPVRSLAGATFARCVTLAPAPEQEPAHDELPGLRLDPLLDLEAIIGLQRDVIRFAEDTRELVALIDVPPGLDPSRIRRWRAQLASSYAAAYHPWLDVARRDDARDSLVRVAPSAIAAGIVAATERAFGVPQGPANALAAEVVRTAQSVAPALHDELHQAGVNVFLRERDGIRLSGARTLSADAAYRQLSVRRLMILLRRVLVRQMQWAAFEPNGPALWREVRGLLETYLRQLYERSAFKGATEAEAFFVACDRSTMTRNDLDNGRMICLVGVAPAEPLEFIVLRIAREGDGTLMIAER